MSNETSRRDLLRNAAVAAALGTFQVADAQHVHEAVKAAKVSGPYKPKLFNEHEWKTVVTLCETICPGATKGNAAEFIDVLASNGEEMGVLWTGGIAWMDGWMRTKYGKNWVEAAPEQQTALLDQIAFRKNDSPALGPGIRFFDFARKMAVDAYYTSAAGIAEIGYVGNKGMREFKVPENVLAYVSQRSPIG